MTFSDDDALVCRDQGPNLPKKTCSSNLQKSEKINLVEELYYPTPLIDFFRRSLYIAFP